MPPRPPSLSPLRGRMPNIHQCIGVVAGSLLLGGCALNGDFGRMRPELVTDNVHSWIGRDAAASVGVPASNYPLTDDEHQLRDLAYTLIAPPYGRQRLDNAFREYGAGRRPRRDFVPFDRAAYWLKLATFSRRSEASAYAQIVTDARNDVDMIEPFFAVAGRVLDMDRRRTQTLSHVAPLNGAEYADAVRRNTENAAVVGWVCRSIDDRAAGYHYALERLAIAAPSPAAADADRTLSLLDMRIRAHCKPVASPVLTARG